MTDETIETPEAMPETAQPGAKAKGKNRFETAKPVLEKLFELYPQLFGARFLPLKLGIYQDLMAAHPEVFKRDDLKTALGVHTRSTRYLQSVAAGLKRHDLEGQPGEVVAPEHIFLSVAELFQRRQARAKEDLKPKLRSQLVTAYAASGLSRQEYLSRLPVLDETITALLDEAMAEVEQQRARRAALAKAFEGSGKTVEEFAASLGMDLAEVRSALKEHC
jgi:hypothetical protein